jgi:hypothetical protein
MMLLPQLLWSSTLILVAAAQHGTSTPANSTVATSTASPEVTLTPKVGHVPLFLYEEEQWSQELLDDLPSSQRRLFAFDSANYTLDPQKKDPASYGNNHAGNSSLARCRVYPGDSAWPKPDEWAHLNRTLGGALYSRACRQPASATRTALAELMELPALTWPLIGRTLTPTWMTQ